MLTLLWLAQFALAGAGIAGCLSSVEIRPAGTLEQFGYPGLEMSGSESVVTTVDLDLGQSVEGYEVVLRKTSGCAAQYRVQWQYETSISVMNEGPHVDLLDWQHYTSPWLDIEPDAAGRYRLPTVTEEQRQQFPPVTVPALVDAVRAAGGDRWATLVADVESPHDYPSSVGLSAYRVRVMSHSSEARPLYSATFKPPMGC